MLTCPPGGEAEDEGTLPRALSLSLPSLRLRPGTQPTNPRTAQPSLLRWVCVGAEPTHQSLVRLASPKRDRPWGGGSSPSHIVWMAVGRPRPGQARPPRVAAWTWAWVSGSRSLGAAGGWRGGGVRVGPGCQLVAKARKLAWRQWIIGVAIHLNIEGNGRADWQ